MAKVFSCVVIGDVLAEPDTIVKAIVTRKSVASRTSFTGTPEELEAAKNSLNKEIAAMHSAGSFPTITTSVVAAGGAEVTIQFTLVSDPDTLLNIAPPPNIVLLCYTPVAQSTLKSLEVLWVPTLTQMFARPQLIIAATRVETLAHQKIMDKVGTKPVMCETIIDKASSWRAVDYVEVSAACNVNLNTLLNALSMACLHIPTQRITTEQAKDQRKECMKPILSTQSVWTYKRHPVTGRVFYGNRITEQSQWTRPDDYDGEEPELTTAEKEAENQAKRQLEEQRIREQHEKHLEEQNRQEVAVHNERVHELEKRTALLTRDAAHLNIRVGEIRDVIERNRREREDLERQQDQITEARFAKSTLDDDLRIERDINDAKIKLFMLEGRVALADEMGVQTTEIAEAILINNSLAQQLRELIAEQLKVRRQGSTSQTRIDTLQRQHEDATALLASLTARAPTVKNTLLAAESELKEAERKRAQLTEKTRSLSSTLHANDHGAYERQQHVNRLQAEIKALDEKIENVKRAKGIITTSSTSSSPTSRNEVGGGGGGGGFSTDKHHVSTHPLAAEEARAQLEQQQLVMQLTAAACECAQYEIGSRQKMELLKYLVSEYNYASAKRVEVANTLSDHATKRRDEKLLGLSYPISNPHELKHLQLAVDERMTELGTTRHRLISMQEQQQRKDAATAAQNQHGGLNTTPRGPANRSASARGGGGGGGRYGFGSTTPTGRSDHNYSMMNTPTRARTLTAGRNAGNTNTANKNGKNGNTEPDSRISQSAHQSTTAALNRTAAIAELKQIKLLLQHEQTAEEAAEQLAELCRTAEQRVHGIKAKGTQQAADLRDALDEALREINNIERLQGYQSSSPLERLVSLVDGVVTQAAQAVAEANRAAKRQQELNQQHNQQQTLEPISVHPFEVADIIANCQLVTEVANAFTERMLNSVPANERAAVAHQLNHAASRDPHHNGPAPSATAIANAIHGHVTQEQLDHHAFVEAAAKRGVLAATAAVVGDAGVGGGAASLSSIAALNEKARRLEARQDSSLSHYKKHAERTKQILGVMQPLTAKERDDNARVQHRFFNKR